MKRIISEEEKTEMVKMYLNNSSLKIIRNKFKTNVSLIKQVLKVHGIEVTCRTTTLNIEYFKYIDTAEKAYWLGFIVADGCVQKSGYKLAFCVKDSDIL